MIAPLLWIAAKFVIWVRTLSRRGVFWRIFLKRKLYSLFALKYLFVTPNQLVATLRDGHPIDLYDPVVGAIVCGVLEARFREEPNYWRAYSLGILYQWMGVLGYASRRADAKRKSRHFFMEALSLAPFSPAGINELACEIADDFARGGELDVALEFLSRVSGGSTEAEVLHALLHRWSLEYRLRGTVPSDTELEELAKIADEKIHSIADACALEFFLLNKELSSGDSTTTKDRLRTICSHRPFYWAPIELLSEKVDWTALRVEDPELAKKREVWWTGVRQRRGEVIL